MNDRHVVHVSSAHPWTDNRIHYREASSLVDLGYKVSLVAVDSPVSAPQTGVRVTTLRPLSRIPRFIYGGLRAIRVALRTRASVFHLHDPELVWTIPLLRLLRKTVIYDAHEDLPEQVMGKSYLVPAIRPIARAFAQATLLMAGRADHVVAATETIAARFPSVPVTVVHNYPPLRPEEDNQIAINSRPERAVYVGGIGIGRGAREMTLSVDESAFPETWTLDIAGSASNATLESLRKTPGWERVNFHGQLPPEQARDLILASRVGFVLLRDTAAYRDSLPTKMFEYFAAGVPVIASDFPRWREIIEGAQCGLLVDQRDPVAIANAVRRYAGDPALLSSHSRNARRLAISKYNWSRVVPRLASAYEQACGEA